MNYKKTFEKYLLIVYYLIDLEEIEVAEKLFDDLKNKCANLIEYYDLKEINIKTNKDVKELIWTALELKAKNNNNGWCTQKWSEMQPIFNEGARKCEHCNEIVYWHDYDSPTVRERFKNHQNVVLTDYHKYPEDFYYDSLTFGMIKNVEEVFKGTYVKSCKVFNKYEDELNDLDDYDLDIADE